MPATAGHPDFHSMSLYAPLPDQTILAPAPAVTTSAFFSGSDTSDQGGVVTNGSVTASASTAYPGTSSDSDRNGISSDSDRNGSSRDGSGGSEEGDRNTSGGSSDGREESTHGLSGCDRNSGYNEDSSGSDPSGSDNERLNGSDGFDSSSSPRSSGRKRSSKKRCLIDRADSSVRGSDSSERSSVRDLSFLTASLAANKQADVPTTIGGNLQDMTTWGAGLPAGMATTFSGLGQSNNAAFPFAAPLTAANLSAVNQPSSANPTAVNQGASSANQPSALTASNLSYLSLQNQLIQSQATIAKLLAYQQQMGLPPMPATAGDQMQPAASTQPPANQDKLQGGST